MGSRRDWLSKADGVEIILSGTDTAENQFRAPSNFQVYLTSLSKGLRKLCPHAISLAGVGPPKMQKRGPGRVPAGINPGRRRWGSVLVLDRMRRIAK
jgi:hypothetical protein